MSGLFNSGIRPVLDAWLLEKSKEQRDYGDYWSASSAGYCMRKNIFDRLHVPYVEAEDAARKQRVFTAGQLFHDWIQQLTKESGLSIAQEVELQDEDLMVRGHFDDLVLIKPTATQEEFRLARAVNDFGSTDKRDLDKVTGIESRTDHLILYDYKTQNSRAFSWQKDRPISYYHKLQLGTYMYMLRNMMISNLVERRITLGVAKDLTEARILKIDKDALRMAESQLLWSDDLQAEVVGYWKALNTWWESYKEDGSLPECTCADREGGFMALEKWNGRFYNGEPCSEEWVELKKKEGLFK